MLCSFFLLTVLPVSTAGNIPFRVEITDDKLSVTAENVPLQTILQVLVDKGITVKIDPAINPPVITDFSQRPIEAALETLLKPASYSLTWESVNHDDNSLLRLIEIQVFQTGSKEQMQILQPRKLQVISKTSEGIYFVKDEILLFIPSEKVMAELRELVKIYNAVITKNGEIPGMLRLILPPDSDVFAIARAIKNKLGLEISQPNYAYPIQPPVVYPVDASLKTNIDPGYFAPTDNSFPIAILDSGLASNSALDKFVLSSLDVLNPDVPINDTLGHGTQMALIASGIVKPYGSESDENDSYIPIIPIRAFDDNGFTTDLKVMTAVNFALENNARVMSLSWGSETRSELIEKTLVEARDKGLIIVASAGNEPSGKPVYPAAYPSVIGIGALGPHGKTWENSNFGNFVTFFAPGFAILPVGYKGDPGMYAGTSISAAFAANTIAEYLSRNPAASLSEIQNFLGTKFQQ